MNSSIEAQIGLQTALVDSHKSVILAGLEEYGIAVTDWPDLMQQPNELMVDFNKRLHEAGDDRAFYGDVYYDETSRAYKKYKKQYPVPLLGASAVTLAVSGLRGEYTDTDEDIFSPSKFVEVELILPKGNKPAFVLTGPDMPAVALHGDDIAHIGESYLGQTMFYLRSEESYKYVRLVEEAFGSEAVEQLSEEACLSLAAAIRMADKNAH